MENKLKLKQNDTRPYLKLKAIDEDGNNVDLTSASITFTMRNRSADTIKVNGSAAVITSASAGEFEYRWAAVNTNTVGIYDGEFQITFADGSILTLPANGYIEIEVADDLS